MPYIVHRRSDGANEALARLEVPGEETTMWWQGWRLRRRLLKPKPAAAWPWARMINNRERSVDYHPHAGAPRWLPASGRRPISSAAFRGFGAAPARAAAQRMRDFETMRTCTAQ